MNKHDIMREKVSTWSREARQDMRQYITVCEATEKELERLQKKEVPSKVVTNDGEHEAVCPVCGQKLMGIKEETEK
jgi:uncharacterized protein with PIN domain